MGLRELGNLYRCRKKACVLILCIAMLPLCLGACENGEYPGSYEVGLLYSTEYDNKSKIEYFDEDGEMVGSSVLPYGYLGHAGFSNAVVVDGMLYECPQGTSNKHDLGIILGIRLEDGKTETFDFKRTNITEFACDGQYIYTSSNISGEYYVDRYERENGEIRTVMAENYVSDLFVHQDCLYGFCSGSGDTGVNLYQFDFWKNTMERRKTISASMEDPPSFTVSYKDELVFVSGNVLYRYDTKKDNLVKEDLPHDNAFNIQNKGKYLYIGYTDIWDGEESWIGIYDLEKHRTVHEEHFDCQIVQIEIKGTDIYVDDFSHIVKYEMDEKFHFDKKQTFQYEQTGNYYVGGFYVK